MNTQQLNINSLSDLNETEMLLINGGDGFWEMIGKGLGATAHFLVYMVKDAVNNPIRPSQYR
ncbi:MAG: hypothetical protein IT249_14905 [Chitinophagaceae bacterium]|nr:hypothetical protein [Chitinophagaceae bacterium]